MSAAQVGAVTGLTAGVMTILFGLIANLPFGLAAGLGINSFLAVAVIHEVTWPEAMGLVVINGILIVLFGVTGARTAIFRLCRKELKAAITVGIGLFIAFIGFVDSGFVRATKGGPPVQLGNDGSITSIPTLVFIVGLLVMGILVARKIQGGLLIGIVATTVLAAVVEAVMHIGPGSASQSRRLAPEHSGAVRPAGVRAGPSAWWATSTSSVRSRGSAGWRPRCWCSPWCSPTSSTPWAP